MELVDRKVDEGVPLAEIAAALGLETTASLESAWGFFMPGGKQTKNVRFPLARLTKSARLVLLTISPNPQEPTAWKPSPSRSQALHC